MSWIMSCVMGVSNRHLCSYPLVGPHQAVVTGFFRSRQVRVSTQRQLTWRSQNQLENIQQLTIDIRKISVIYLIAQDVEPRCSDIQVREEGLKRAHGPSSGYSFKDLWCHHLRVILIEQVLIIMKKPRRFVRNDIFPEPKQVATWACLFFS